jgi:hypothetical protein
MGAENLTPSMVQSWDHPACSQSLYRLRYPGPIDGFQPLLSVAVSAVLLTKLSTTCHSSIGLWRLTFGMLVYAGSLHWSLKGLVPFITFTLLVDCMWVL